MTASLLLWMALVPGGGGTGGGEADKLRAEGFVPLFDGKTLDGWKVYSAKKNVWTVEDGMIVCQKGEGGGWLGTLRDYANFEVRLEYRLQAAGNSGVYIRAETGGISRVGMEIQILDDTDPKYSKLDFYQYTGSIYHVVPPKVRATKPAGQWNAMAIRADRRQVAVVINGKKVVDADLDHQMKDPAVAKEHTGLARTTGRIGLQSHQDRVEFRNLWVKELAPQENRKVELKKGDRVLFFGDSLTYLAGKEEPPKFVTKGYVRIVQETLDKTHKELGIQVDWVATGGHTVPDLLARLEKDVLPKKPTIVVIQIGCNDARRLPKEKFKASLEELIDHLHKEKIQVVQCTLTSVGEKHDGTNKDDPKLDEFAEIQRQIIKAKNVPFIDLRKAFVEHWKANNPDNKGSGILTYDGNHFNDAGMRFVAEQMIKAFKIP